MFIKNFYAYTDKHQSAEHGNLVAQKIRAAKQTPQLHARRCHGRAHESYDDRGPPHRNAYHGKGEPHGHGVYAGGHGQHDELPPARGIAGRRFLLFPGPGFAQHVDPDERQQTKGYPVIPGLDVAAHRHAESPADDRHEKLKQAEMKRETEIVSPGHHGKRGRGGHRNGKGVHGQRERYG